MVQQTIKHPDKKVIKQQQDKRHNQRNQRRA